MVNLARLKAVSNTPQALKNILSSYDWKKSSNGYRAKQHGSYSIYCKKGTWLFAAHNGDFKGGDALTVAAELHNLDLKTKEGLYQAAAIVCQATGLRFEEYCNDSAPIPSQATESRVIETKQWIPNAGQEAKKSFQSIDYAANDSNLFKEFGNFYENKTGIKPEELTKYGVIPLKSLTKLSNRKQIFTDKNLARLYNTEGGVSSKIKWTNPKQQFFYQSSGNYVFGLSNLPDTNKRKNFNLIIVEGEDDANCINYNLHEWGICAITGGSASARFGEDWIDLLKTQFKGVYTFYDNDETGKKMSVRNEELYGLPYIEFNQFDELSHCKDVCDIYQKEGARILKTVILFGIRTRTVRIQERVFDKTTIISAKEGEYLSDILTKEGLPFTIEAINNTIFVAPTGTGKSVFFSKIEGKKVVVCPTIALCKNFIKHGAVISTGMVYDKRETILASDFIVTTHANLPNLLTIIDPKNYLLCVDESHNFTSSASRNFMLNDLKRTLRLSKSFAGRCFATGTDLYNFHTEFADMKKIIVSIPKPQKQATIIEAKSVIQTTIDKAKESIRNERFPIVLLNNKKGQLKQLIEGVKGLDFYVLNSDEKETAFFKELTETGIIPDGVKGIITTSVIKEGNDIYNQFDFDFLVCNTHEAIFHSIEIEQLANRARQAKGANVSIIKPINRKKINDIFYPNESMRYFKKRTETRCNELNNTPIQYLPYEKNAQFGNGYAYTQNENGVFELCELLLSYNVFEQERHFEFSNDVYQQKQLEKFGFIFSDTTIDETEETEDIKEIFNSERALRKERKLIDFEATKNEILEQIENGNDVVLPNVDTASDGKSFAVSCYERLTEVGIHPSQVFNLIDTEGVRSENTLNRVVKSISLWQLNRDDTYMNLQTITGLRLSLIFDSIEVGKQYSTGQLRGVMRRFLNLEKGFNTRMFDANITSQKILDFTRLFFELKINNKTGLRTIKGIKNWGEYLIDDKETFLHPKSLIINKLSEKFALDFSL